MDLCITLLPDVVAPEAHQNDRSLWVYIIYALANLLSISIVGDCTEEPSWAVGACLEQYSISNFGTVAYGPSIINKNSSSYKN